jgi:hypothetical protein
MKAPRPGTKKAQVFDAYMRDGRTAALALASTLELANGTAHSWLSEWKRFSGKIEPAVPPAPKKRARINASGGKRERAVIDYGPTQASLVPRGGWFDAHFRYSSRAAADRAHALKCKDLGMGHKAFHVIEDNGRFALAPAHYNPSRELPQFKKGDTVFDITIPNTRGVIVEAGPEQSEVSFKTGMFEGKQWFVSNYYLTTLPGEAVTVRMPKRARIKRK